MEWRIYRLQPVMQTMGYYLFYRPFGSRWTIVGQNPIAVEGLIQKIISCSRGACAKGECLWRPFRHLRQLDSVISIKLTTNKKASFSSHIYYVAFYLEGSLNNTTFTLLALYNKGFTGNKLYDFLVAAIQCDIHSKISVFNQGNWVTDPFTGIITNNCFCQLTVTATQSRILIKRFAIFMFKQLFSVISLIF